MAHFDDLKLSVEQLSGGKNTVLFDDKQMPSIMVPFNKFLISDVITGGSSNTHPAFSVGGVEKDVIYVSKFLNMVINDRAYSLAGKDPKASVNFDTALGYCRNKGTGWCLTPFSVWAAIALWCRKNGTMPRGNNDYGADHGYPLEKGTPSMARDSSNRVQRTATGSGPNTWNHNWMPDGIADLNGNVFEWCAGTRLNGGEIQIIPYANIFDPEVSNGATSTAWKAILADGSLVAPGSENTLKYDYLNSKITLINGTVTDAGTTGRSTGYKDLALDTGLTAPELLKALTLYPDDPGGDYGGDNRYATLGGERLPLCGGHWSYASGTGVFCVYLDRERSYTNAGIGFRSAFCAL